MKWAMDGKREPERKVGTETGTSIDIGKNWGANWEMGRASHGGIKKRIRENSVVQERTN